MIDNHKMNGIMMKNFKSSVFLWLLFSLMNCGNLLAQSTTVSGMVLSEEDNQPVVGATVLIRGTAIGGITDTNGRFTIPNAPATARILLISYVGMETMEVPIQPDMIVKMKPITEMLDEIMVVAYGTAKKSSFTGSASVVRADDIKDLPSTSFENALNGKVAGLQLTTNSGQAGSAPNIRIRGIGSMNASNEPLYVVDGVPVISGSVGQMSSYTYTTNNVMNSLNSEDIESISILKDAAASSLYGSRAANGVILITTKRGKMGKPIINLKSSVGFTPSWATDNYESASTQEQVNMLYMVFHDYRTSNGRTENEANTYALSQLNRRFNRHGYSFTTNGTGLYENVNIADYENSGRANQYFDWENAYFRTAIYQTHDLSVSGATPNTNYYTSLSYTKDEGRLRKNNFERISGRVNLTQKVGSFFDIGTSVNLSRTTNEGYNDTRSTGANYFLQTRNLLWGLYWPTDFVTDQPWKTRYGSYAYNGLYYDEQWNNKSINNRLTATETVTLHLLPEFDIRSILSYDNTTVKDHIYYNSDHFSGAANNGTVNEMRTIYEKIVSSTTANYNKIFGVHEVGALVGFEAEKNTTDFVRATGNNLPTSTLHTVATAGTQSSSGYSWGNSMVSILSKIDYNYAQRYYASASFRRDGSSRLDPNHRWGDFWSVAGSWRMSGEEFLQNHPTISNLRIRASYGVNGTLPSSNYGYMSLMGFTAKYMNNPGGTLNTVGNDNLSWETSYTTNLGLDFGLFNQRLTASVEYFNRDSKDLLQDVPISTVTGFSSALRNIGQINNKGVELELWGNILDNLNGWNWSAGLNAAFIKSRVTKLYNGADIIWNDPTGSDSRAQYVYREGESTLAFYGYEWAGVDKTNGKSVYYVNDENASASDFQYNGRNATYNFRNANYVILGEAIPKVSGGINTNVSYKGINLGLNFLYKIGGKLYDGAYKDVADDGYYWERIRAKSYYENMWTENNPNGTQPRLDGNDLTDAIQYSSRHLHDASFLRLKNMSLGYALPKLFVSKLHMGDARVFFNASNIWTMSKYREADPEVNSFGTRGWETPFGKTYVFGIELKF